MAEAKELEGGQLIQGRTKCGKHGLHDHLFLHISPVANVDICQREDGCKQMVLLWQQKEASDWATERGFGLSEGLTAGGQDTFAAFSGSGFALGGGDCDRGRSRLISSGGGGGGGSCSNRSNGGGGGGEWNEDEKQLQAALRASMEGQHAPARSAVGAGGGISVICLDSSDESEHDVMVMEEQGEKYGEAHRGRREEGGGIPAACSLPQRDSEKEPMPDHSHFAVFSGAGYTLGGGAAKKAKAL